MTQSEQLLEFIDGTLGEDAEQSLFDTLAHERELRSELRQHVSIGRAVQSDRDAFAPPGYLDTAILSGIGASSVAAGTPGLFAGLGKLIAAFVLGLLFAGFGTYWMMSNSTGTGAYAQRTATGRDSIPSGSSNSRVPAALSRGDDSSPKPGTVVADAALGTSAVPLAASSAPAQEVSAPLKASLRAPRTRSSREFPLSRRKTSRMMPPAGNGSDVSLDGTSSGQTLRSVPLGLETISPVTVRRPSTDPLPLADGDAGIDRMIRSRQIVTANPTIEHPGSSPLDPLPAQQSSVTAELRAQSARSIVRNSARSVGAVFPENFAAGVYYRVDRNLSLGVEAGRERYAQTLYVDNSDTLLIEQRPSLSWVGVTARYNYTGLPITQLQPFIQITAGATVNGPVIRGRLGARYEFTLLGAQLAVLAAGETSSLFYRYNGQYSASGRWGITYGLEVSLW